MVDGAVIYGRAGGASFWRAAAGGIEEWLTVAPGAAPAGEPAAVWEVDGAALRQRGEAVEVVDAAGTPRLRVTAPRAFAEGGRPIAARLEARGAEIALLVEASGELVLVDPLWRPVGAMAKRRDAGIRPRCWAATTGGSWSWAAMAATAMSRARSCTTRRTTAGRRLSR